MPRLGRIERILRVFTDVRPGEGPTALVLFANVFLILCAYYLIKPLRETIHAAAPGARLVRLNTLPVVGGVLLAMKLGEIEVGAVRSTLIESTHHHTQARKSAHARPA